MKPRERRGGWCSGGERYSKTNDIAAARETGTRGRWRRKIKRGTRGKTDRSEGNALVGWGCGYLFCGEERNYFMGVDSDAVGNSGRMRHPSSAHPHWKWRTPIYYTTSSRLEPSYQLFFFSLFFAITVILLSRPRREMLVLFLAVEHASWRVELKTVDCKWYGRVAHVFCQMNHFKRIDGGGSEFL